ncbi:MAG TPA: nitrite reductase small subunit NirD [Caulobacteraceae bacterium]|nr:nitrite reductase small subunit NirD [Caulobacteraceae bacterium]
MNASVSPPRIAWIEVGRAEQVPPRGSRRLTTALGPVAVFRTSDGQLFALVDRCPHKGGPLSQGIVHGQAVTCPLHNWQISLTTGRPLGADAGHGCAPTVPVEEREGRIFLGLTR